MPPIVRFIHDVFHDASRACKKRRSVPPPRQTLSKGKTAARPSQRHKQGPLSDDRFAPLAEAGHGTHDLAELPPALQVPGYIARTVWRRCPSE